MEFVDIHTHKQGEGIYILDISDGKIVREGELCTYGIHPMFIRSDEDLSKLEKLAEDSKIIAIGEAGLDVNSETELSRQKILLEQEVEISEKYSLPLIIHCVRAFPELISLYNKRKPVQPWIIHGYNNNREILQQLLRHGFYLSAGKALLYPNSNIRELLPMIPKDRLFLETDDSDHTIETIYNEAALLLNISVSELEKIIFNNFANCFGTKKPEYS